jgi:hypothetical protein
MSRKLRMGKTRALAASLALVGAALFSSAASAQYDGPPGCEQLESECAAKYQRWGYATCEACIAGEQCYACFPGIFRGWDPRLPWFTAPAPRDTVKLG